MLVLLPAAMVMVWIWSRYLAHSSQGEMKDRLIATVWTPVLGSLGFLGMLWDRSGVLGEGGASAIGMGAIIFAVMVGAMLLLSGSSSRQASDGELLASVPMAWPEVGVVILLTAASAKVPHLVGLIVCAIALVLLWINSMPADSRRDHEASVPDPHAGYLAATLVLGLLLAACAWLATPWIPAIVLTVISLTGLALVMLVTSHRGASQGIQAAGWLAILLPCLGLGLLGHDQLFEMIQAGTSSAVPRLHETIGLLGPGLIILVTTLVIRGSRDWSPLWRWYSGLGLFLVGILTGGLAVRGLLS